MDNKNFTTFEESLKLSNIGFNKPSNSCWVYYTDSQKRGLHTIQTALKLKEHAEKKFGANSKIRIVYAYSFDDLYSLILPFNLSTTRMEHLGYEFRLIKNRGTYWGKTPLKAILKYLYINFKRNG